MLGGYDFGPKYNWKDFEQNLTTGKPVKVSGVAGQGKDAEVGENANDGWVGNGKSVGRMGPAAVVAGRPAEASYNLDRIRLFPWDYGGRVFQYTIEVSTDEKNWTKVVDESKNDKPEMGQGHDAQIQAGQGPLRPREHAEEQHPERGAIGGSPGVRGRESRASVQAISPETFPSCSRGTSHETFFLGVLSLLDRRFLRWSS